MVPGFGRARKDTAKGKRAQAAKDALLQGWRAYSETMASQDEATKADDAAISDSVHPTFDPRLQGPASLHDYLRG